MSAKPNRKPFTLLMIALVLLGLVCIAFGTCIGVIWITRPASVPETPLALESAVPITLQNLDRVTPLYQFNITNTVMSLRWSPDNRRLALFTRTIPGLLGEPLAYESLFLWDTSSGTGQRLVSAKHSPVGGSAGISSFAFSPDGQSLAFKVETSITFWDVAQNREQKTLDKVGSLDAESAFQPKMTQPNYPVDAIPNMYTFHPSPDDQVMAVAFWDSANHTIPKLKLYDADSGKELHALAGSLDVLFSHDSRLIATQDRTRDMSQFAPIIVSEVENGQVLQRLQGDIDGASMLFSPSDQLIVGRDFPGGQTFVWVVSSGKRVALKNGSNQPRVAAFSPDERFLAIGNQSGLVQLWGVKP